MKTRYLLPALFALGTVVVSSQTFADLTYDPCCNYYSEYYGTGVEAKTTTPKTQEEEASFAGSFSDYYNTNYTTNQVSSNNVSSEDYPDMADPTNYYKW